MSAQPSSLEQRIAKLEAIEAIKQLKARYLAACDQKQVEQIRDCFVEQSVDIDYGAVGRFSHRDQLVALFDQVGNHDYMVEMHHAQNPQITIIDEDTAEAEWGLFYYLVNTQENSLTQLGGCYRDGYRRIDGQWYIAKSHFSVDSTVASQLSDGVAQVVFAGNPQLQPAV
ncbi:hypothetical protein SIN8267_03332 [Sinobacterium norvegicum]|uniref:SnoaL-like domain-containing protein n=1 Tax=Sinobacterium norvegicum TaxID=1641715 RepID=A0ABN8ES95_9GAMM|nr:nuclear transport factor 2 family protein [Sinobacterium norvegicum]CAH0993191.1 hypothetical protein SIN8267_03332 [Sinobacterium norvegicum]